MKLIFGERKWISVVFCCLIPFVSSKSVIAESISQLEPKTTTCSVSLSKAIARIVNSPQLARSRWGIEVQTTRGEVLYSLNGHKFFTPASSAKLLTTAAVLSSLGGNYRFDTPIFAEGNAPNLASLRFQGKGDPSISTESLKQIVHQLQGLGIKKIERLIVDDSYFEPPAINPTWEWLDVHSYFATAANSTILNQNTVTLTLLPQKKGEAVKFYWSDRFAGRQWQVINQGITGDRDIPYGIEIDGDLGKPLLLIRGELAANESPDIWDMAVVDPGNYFLESWRWHLEQGGIQVNRGMVITKEKALKPERLLLTIPSPSLEEIIREINQESNNLYAEVIAKVLAKELNIDSGIKAIEQSLKQLGIKKEEYVLVDASGLSRQNLVSPKTLVKILRIMLEMKETDSNIYQQSLAVAGTNGTLKHRFQDSPIKGKLKGKTGTLTGVASLAGYLVQSDRSTLIFSIVVNNSELSSRQLRQEIDQVVKVLDRFKQCSRSQ